MTACVPHVTSGLGLRKFQADGFLLTRVYLPEEKCSTTAMGFNIILTKTAQFTKLYCDVTFQYSTVCGTSVVPTSMFARPPCCYYTLWDIKITALESTAIIRVNWPNKI